MAKQALQFFDMFGTAGADLSVASTTSLITNVQFQDNIGIQITWTGTSPVGAITIDCSNDYGRNGVLVPTWISLDFGSAIVITGNSGTHTININQIPFSNIRATYTKGSGVGTLHAQLSAKSVGGS